MILWNITIRCTDIAISKVVEGIGAIQVLRNAIFL